MIREELDEDVKYLLSNYPMASIILSYPDPFSGQLVAYANQNIDSGPLEDYEVPPWLGDREFSGLVLEDANHGADGSRLFLKSTVISIYCLQRESRLREWNSFYTF